MKNILKNKKLLIGLGVAILLIIAIVVVVLVTNPKSENNEIPNNNVDTNTNTNTPVAMEETHTMYVSINPLVKLVFKEEYTICKDENNQEYVCGNKISLAALAQMRRALPIITKSHVAYMHGASTMWAPKCAT